MSDSLFALRLTEQIGNEFAASQQYIAIAVYYDGETLPQLAGHFYRQSVEERNHAMMMVQYLLDVDAPARIPGVAAPQTDFEDIVAPVALARERDDDRGVPGPRGLAGPSCRPHGARRRGRGALA